MRAHFMRFFFGNVALVFLGYEAGTTVSVPVWAIVMFAVGFCIFFAAQTARMLVRAYDREDHAVAALQRLLTSTLR